MGPRLPSPAVLLSLTAVVAGLVAPSPSRAAARVEIVDLDGPGEGLNDPTPMTPAGGNPGTTLGEARRAAVEFAVAVWAENLASAVPIRLGVRFDPLGGTATEATLGLGGPEDVFRDFAGAPRPATWYPAALADRLAGLDLEPEALDLELVFNSDVDGGVVLGSARFDYGFDGQDAQPGGGVEFLEAAVHELAHGLGWTTFLDLATGAKLLGYDDAYLLHLERHGATPADFPSMSDAERRAAATAGAEVHWVGPQTVVAAAGLTAGIGAAGHLELHAPSPLVPAASLTHLSAAFDPDQVMEPFYAGALELDRGLGLTSALLADLGWGPEPACASLSPAPPFLLEETFDDGDFAGWTAVDYGTVSAPSAWSVVAGELVQSSNIYTDPQNLGRGTYAFYEEGSGWTDYKVSLGLRSADDDWIGVMFRYQDGENFYRFDWSRQGASRRLVKVVDGQLTVLQQDTVAYRTGDTTFVGIAVEGNSLRVEVDGGLVFAASDGSLASGSIALSSYSNAGSYFDNVRVVAGPVGSPSTLVVDDFNDGNYAGWVIRDVGTQQGPSSWSASSRYLAQTSNIFTDPLRRGTYAELVEGASWTDYRVSLELWSQDDDEIGLLFRYRDPENFNRFAWSRELGRRQLVVVAGGVLTVLAEDSVPYETGDHYYVEVAAVGNELSVWIDGAPVFTVEDSSHGVGTIALSSYGNDGSYFENVRVLAGLPAPSPPLFVDDFSDGDYSGWTIHDVGVREGPSSWTASSGALVQSSNILDDPLRRGTYALLGQGAAWTDYLVSVDVRSQDDDWIGVMLRYQDAENFYRFEWSRQQSRRQLVAVVGGVLTVLAEDGVAYEMGRYYHVEVSAVGDEITVRVDGVPVLSAEDSNLGGGTIALSCYGNTGSSFDNVKVTSTGGQP